MSYQGGYEDGYGLLVEEPAGGPPVGVSWDPPRRRLEWVVISQRLRWDQRRLVRLDPVGQVLRWRTHFEAEDLWLLGLSSDRPTPESWR